MGRVLRAVVGDFSITCYLMIGFLACVLVDDVVDMVRGRVAEI